MTISFDGRVAIITGAGRGLGRAHALALAERGAHVVVNDMSSADDVVAEIREKGGKAIADGADVTDPEAVAAMVEAAMGEWGHVDILVNNAGILRDKSFAKMTAEDFRAVVDVHLFGAFNCCKAVWEIMRAQNYGRIVMTSSSSGLYGNFGQANYGAAKMGVVGLMNVLHQEGAKYDIRVNALAPAAATQMTEGLLPPGTEAVMGPELVSPGLLYLVSDDAPSHSILGAGAGNFAAITINEADGVRIGGEGVSVDDVAAQWDAISAMDGATAPDTGFWQTERYIRRALGG